MSDRKKALLLIAVMLYGLVVGKNTVTAAQSAEAKQSMETAQTAVSDKMQISELSQIMTAKETVAMKEEANDKSEALMSYEKGASVFVTGQTDDGWYRVSYQDKEGYVPVDSLTLQDIDIEKLDEEMEDNAKEAVFVVETVEKYHREAAYDKIWFGMIAVLVAGIFAVGIVSAVKKKKRKK